MDFDVRRVEGGVQCCAALLFEISYDLGAFCLFTFHEACLVEVVTLSIDIRAWNDEKVLLRLVRTFLDFGLDRLAKVVIISSLDGRGTIIDAVRSLHGLGEAGVLLLLTTGGGWSLLCVGILFPEVVHGR